MISTASMEGVHVEMHVIRLTFDYVKKDRRERAYVMEDVRNAEVRCCTIEEKPAKGKKSPNN